MLKSIDNGKLYTGSTQNLAKRLDEHNGGKSKATKAYRPFELIHSEGYNTRAEAYRREMYLKTGRGREELRNILWSSYNG